MEYSGNGSISSKRSKQLEWRLDRKSGIMPDMHSGLVAHIQRFSLHDGPGIRTTVFLKGCPLGCLWCHNPENRSSQPEVMVVESRCVRCGRCDPVCPSHSADAPSAVDRRPAVFVCSAGPA